MTSDGLLVVQFLFSSIWEFFTAWKIPGTGVTPAAFLLFLVIGGISLRLVVRLLSRSSSAGSGISGIGSRFKGGGSE